MQQREVDVAILGAGSAGLYALSQVKRAGKSYVIMDGGPLGTTCARVGCMPSKAVIQIGHDLHRRRWMERAGVAGTDRLRPDPVQAMALVRKLRDGLSAGPAARVEKLGEHFIPHHGCFVAPGVIEAGDVRVQAGSVIIATGSSPVVPRAWQAFGSRVLTTDTLFEQDELGPRLAVVGLGAIGLELGQALVRWGLEVHGFDLAQAIGGIQDYVVQAQGRALIGRELPMTLGHEVHIEAVDGGLRISAGKTEFICDQVLASLGRRPNLGGLNLEAAGIEVGEDGQPDFDPQTMQIGQSRVFLAGDVDGQRPLLHEAGDEGRIAGYNACVDTPRRWRRKTPLGIVFTDPNLCVVGPAFDSLDEDEIAIGEADFTTQGRAVLIGEDSGVLRVYAEVETGRLIGASMACPGGEHIAHLLAWSIEQGLTVFDLLKMPFYHPVLEEGLQDALYDLLHEVEAKAPRPLELRPAD